VPEIKTIAVIGAGRTGRGIAQIAALAGYRTILEDILPASLRRAETEISGEINRAVELGRYSREQGDVAIRRLEFATSLEDAAREAEMVIETVPQEFDSKEEIFRLLDRICRPDTVLASNTISLPVTDIAAVTERPEKVVGMRFSDPVHEMKSLEVIRAAKTDEDSLQAAVTVGRRMGLETSVVHERALSAPHS